MQTITLGRAKAWRSPDPFRTWSPAALVAVAAAAVAASPAQAAWSPPASISSTANKQSRATTGPNFGVLAATDSAIAWSDDSTRPGLRLASRSGAAWGKSTLIASVEDAAAATSDGGAVAVVYERRSGSAGSSAPSSGRGGKGTARRASAASARYAIWAVTADAGKGWSKPVRVSPRADKLCSAPTVARSRGGGGPVVAAWRCYRGTTRTVVMTAVLRDGKWSRPTVIADRAATKSNPLGDREPGASVTVTESGVARVAWLEWDRDAIRVRYRSWQAGSWSPPSTLSEAAFDGDAVNDIDTYNPLAPSHLAPSSDAAGELLVPLFRWSDPTRQNLEVVVGKTAGGAPAPPVVVSSSPARHPSYVQLGPRLGGSGIRLVADGTGRVVAVWTDVADAPYQSSDFTLMLAERQPDGSWSAPRAIGKPSGCAGCTARSFTLGGNWRGDIVVAWPENVAPSGSEPNYRLTALSRTPDGSWSDPEPVAESKYDWDTYLGNTRTGNRISLFVDAAGKSTLSWRSCTGNPNLKAQSAGRCVVAQSTRPSATTPSAAPSEKP